MDPQSVTLILNLVRTTFQVGSELKSLMARVEAGEIITLEELQIADDEQVLITEQLKDL